MESTGTALIKNNYEVISGVNQVFLTVREFSLQFCFYLPIGLCVYIYP